MIRKHKWQLIISSIIILLPILSGLLIWNYLPEQIKTHWNINGEPNRWTGKGFAILGIPLIIFAAHWICILAAAHDPKNKDQSSKAFHMILWILPITSLILSGHTYAIALGYEVNIDMPVRILLGLMFIILGNYMPKCKQNQTIGVKVTWTLRNEENWYKTHRFTGKLWLIGGLFLLITTFVPVKNLMYIFFPLLLMSVAPMIYSYVYYRKQLIAGTATKEDAVQTPLEKATNKIALIVIIFILVFIAIIFCTGKFEVTFHETSFTIDATYWNDATIVYTEISNIEYREQDDPNASMDRTFGYGDFKLLMGEFKNDEFGAYTRYSYTSCDSCVVITINDRILVINGEDTEQTKEFYDELCKRINKGE